MKSIKMLKNIRTFIAVSLFLCDTVNLYSQNSITTNWDLNKYIWSHTHHNPIKPGKPIIDFNIMDNWEMVKGDIAVSPNGKYVVYSVGNYEVGGGDKTFRIVAQSTDNAWQINLPYNNEPKGFFTADSKYYVVDDELTGLCFFTLGTNDRKYIKDLQSYQEPNQENEGGVHKWLALHYKSNDLVLLNLLNGQETKFENISNYRFSIHGTVLICETGGESPQIILYNCVDGQKKQMPRPNSYMLSWNAKLMLISSDSYLDYVNLDNDKKLRIWSPAGSNSESLVSQCFNENEEARQVAFTTKTKSGAKSIWYWNEDMPTAKMLVNDSTDGIRKGLFLNSDITFSDNGRYLQFSLLKPAEVYEKNAATVPVTIWDYKDSVLQSQQTPPKDENYRAYYSLKDEEIAYVEDVNESSYLLGDCLFIKAGALVRMTEHNYNAYRFWERGFNQSSSKVINLSTGSNYSLGGCDNVQLSPDGDNVVYIDPSRPGRFCSLNIRNGIRADIAIGTPNGLFVKNFVNPRQKNENGIENWHWVVAERDVSLLIKDDYDIWQLDPSGEKPPVNLTNGYGRSHNIVFDITSTEHTLRDSSLLLTAFALKTKYNGYYRKQVGAPGDPEILYMGPCTLQNVRDYIRDVAGAMPLCKAADVNIWVLQRQSVDDGNNYYITQDFKDFRRLTNLQPHKKVNWYTSEVHYFKSDDGVNGEGILFKPENFDPKKKYPVAVVWYGWGWHSNELYASQGPKYPMNPIVYMTNPAWLVSHGYLVFVPNTYIEPIITSKRTYLWAEGAAKYLQRLPYVDGKHIAGIGHSGTAKSAAYAMTHSKTFAALLISEGYTYGNLINTAFAPTENKNSSLQDIEIGWGFGNFWEHKDTWLDQTTLVNIDKVQMPVMLYCNDGRGANEYFKQTFEIYTALRRLNKPAWWFQYFGGGHNIANPNELKDWSIRILQFLDHYLKCAPAPRWMTQGLPNHLREVELRMELDPTGTCALKNDCPICCAWSKQYKRHPEMFDSSTTLRMTKPISEWKLDDDIKKEMERKEAEKYNKNMVGEAERIKENTRKLRQVEK